MDSVLALESKVALLDNAVFWSVAYCLFGDGVYSDYWLFITVAITLEDGGMDICIVFKMVFVDVLISSECLGSSPGSALIQTCCWC